MFINISVKEALAQVMAGKARLYDLREQDAYQAGHLPTALWITEENLKKKLRERKEPMVVLYCDFGNYSLKIAKELWEEGIFVSSIVGGYHAYEGYIEKKQNEMWTMEWKTNGQF